MPAFTEWNPISLPARNSEATLLAKDFSFLQCCTWSIQRSTFGWPASWTSTATCPPPHFTLSFLPPTPCNTLPSEKKWLITITSGSGSHHLILLHTQSPSPLSHPSIPGCPPVLSLCFFFLFNFTGDQLCCQAIYLFRAPPQIRGHPESHGCPQYLWLDNQYAALTLHSHRLLATKFSSHMHHDQSVPRVHNSFRVSSL